MKKPSSPGKTENEGTPRVLLKTDQETGLILLFVGEVGRSPWASDRDEHNQTGILTPGFNLIPAFPNCLRN
jgi:hypothetical protein